MPRKKTEDKRGRRTNLYLYADDLDNVQALTRYAFNNGAQRANVSLVVRAALAVLASSPSKRFIDAMEEVSKSDQRFKETRNDAQRRNL